MTAGICAGGPWRGARGANAWGSDATPLLLPADPFGQHDQRGEAEAEPGRGVAEVVVGEVDVGLAALRQRARRPGWQVDEERGDRLRQRGSERREAIDVAQPIDAMRAVRGRRE